MEALDDIHYEQALAELTSIVDEFKELGLFDAPDAQGMRVPPVEVKLLPDAQRVHIPRRRRGPVEVVRETEHIAKEASVGYI